MKRIFFSDRVKKLCYKTFYPVALLEIGEVLCFTEPDSLKFEMEVFFLSCSAKSNPIVGFHNFSAGSKINGQNFYPVHFGFVATINSLSDKANLWINSRNMQFSELVYSVSSPIRSILTMSGYRFRIIKPANKNWIYHFICCPFSEE